MPPPPTSFRPLTEQLANALSQHDYSLALRVANELEIDIQVCRGYEEEEGRMACVVEEKRLSAPVCNFWRTSH